MKSFNFKALVVCALLVANLFLTGSSPAVAQDQAKNDLPKVSEGEAKLANKLQSSKDFAEKMKTAAEFIKKYPNSPIRRQVAQFVAAEVEGVSDPTQKLAEADNYTKIFANPEEANLIAPARIDAFVRVKRYDDAYKLAESYFSQNAGDVRMRLLLSVEGSNMAQLKETKFAKQSLDYTVKAIELIEANQKPADINDQSWKEYQTRWLAQLYQSSGFLQLSNGNRAAARTAFDKASKLAPAEPNNWIMLGTMLNEEYQLTAKRHFVAEGKEKEELQKRAEQQLDQVIELFAKIVALTDGNTDAQHINKQVRQDLETYYKFRHNNSTQGMQELIDKHKAAKPNN